jgi:protein-tyrosine phosphatase
VIDLHCHVLPGIDDGPERSEESLALARASGAAGVDTLVATSHVSWHYRNDAATLASLTADLNARLSGSDAEGGVAVKVLPGAEVAASMVMDLDTEELRRLGLGGGRWLLLEPPLASSAAGLEIVVAELQRRGHGIVLAHPERCPAFHRDTRLLESLIEGGALTSITAGSLTGRFGGTVRRFTHALLKAGAVHNVASDFHDLTGRPPGMSAALESAGLAALSDWLTHEVPLAILEDRELPHKPSFAVPVPAPERRGLWARARSLRRAL